MGVGAGEEKRFDCGFMGTGIVYCNAFTARTLYLEVFWDPLQNGRPIHCCTQQFSREIWTRNKQVNYIEVLFENHM